jgi:hypothetical protein
LFFLAERSSPNCSCSSERTGLQPKRKSAFRQGRNKRRKLSHVSETLSQTEDAKYSEDLGSGDNVLPIIVSKRGTPRLWSDEQEDTSDTKNENGTKDAPQCTSLESQRKGGSCSRILSSGSQAISRRNCSWKESAERLATSLEFGTKNIKYSHCNVDDESHDLKMDSKRGRETSTSNPAVASIQDGDESETTDDIFYYRCPQNSSLHCEGEKQTNTETVHSDSQNKSGRGASGKISESSVASECCSDDRRVFGENSDHGATETRKRTENSAAGDGKNTGRKSLLRRMKRETRSSHNAARSKRDENGRARNGRKSAKQENVLTTSRRKATALKHSVGSNVSDDSGDQNNGNILHRQRRSDPSHCSTASDHEKSESYISDGSGLQKVENILTRLKKQMKSSNSSFGSKHNITEDVSGDGENPNKESFPSRRKNRMKMRTSSDGSKYVQNGGHIADDGKSPEKENVLKSRERGTETHRLRASGHDDTLFVSDVGYTSKNESVFITGEIRRMPKRHKYDRTFNTSHKRSLPCKKDKRKTNNIFNENRTSLKSSRSNKRKCVMNSSSHNKSTRSNVPRESPKHSVTSVVCRNGSTVSSDEKSAGSGYLADSHRQQFSADITQKLSSHGSGGNIHKMDSKLMKTSGTKTGSEHTETEEELDDDDDDDDIFYITPRRSSLREKETGRQSSFCGNKTLIK